MSAFGGAISDIGRTLSIKPPRCNLQEKSSLLAS
jgi:hypothetical protein